MASISKEWLSFLREQYPEGRRIILREMKDPYDPVPPGTMGTLRDIDATGMFHVCWDNGRTLSLVVGVDRFTVLPPQPNILKLYMPLTGEIFGRNEWGELDYDGSLMDGRDLRPYYGQIIAEMEDYREPAEKERGLMYYYKKGDGVDCKVESANFTVEERNGLLWGVAECRVLDALTPEELKLLKEYLRGQASDGWGEGFEQHAIYVDDGELNVHLWNSTKEWKILTEEERFAPKLAEGLPEKCFATIKSTGELIMLKRGERGYYQSDWSTSDKEYNKTLANDLNEQLGVTFAQCEAMEIGSMFGWGVPGADPAFYAQEAVKEVMPMDMQM